MSEGSRGDQIANQEIEWLQAVYNVTKSVLDGKSFDTPFEVKVCLIQEGVFLRQKWVKPKSSDTFGGGESFSKERMFEMFMEVDLGGTKKEVKIIFAYTGADNPTILSVDGC